MPGRFPDLTPEESDESSTPDENRLLSAKPGEINHLFSHLFSENLTVILDQECVRPIGIYLGWVRTVHNGENSAHR